MTDLLLAAALQNAELRAKNRSLQAAARHAVRRANRAELAHQVRDTAPQTFPPDVVAIARAVEAVSHIRMVKIVSYSRKSDIAQARWALFYLLKKAGHSDVLKELGLWRLNSIPNRHRPMPTDLMDRAAAHLKASSAP